MTRPVSRSTGQVTPEALVGLIRLVEAGTINTTTAKDVLGAMAETGRGAETIVRSAAWRRSATTPPSKQWSIVYWRQPRDSTKLPGWQRSLVWVAGRPGNEGDQGQANARAGQPDHARRLETMRTE